MDEVGCNTQLIRARIELCLTQLHVSRVIGIRPSLYGQWERGVQPHGMESSSSRSITCAVCWAKSWMSWV